jgi:hypothetical protein
MGRGTLGSLSCAPQGLSLVPLLAHGIRRGLHSFAASRLHPLPRSVLRCSQSTVRTSSGSISTNEQFPVAVEQERIPRRRIFTGVSSGKVRRYSAVRRASVKPFSFSLPLVNFTASTVASEPLPRLSNTKNSALPVSLATLPRSTVRNCCNSSLCLATAASTLALPPVSEASRSRVSGMGRSPLRESA